MAVFFKMKLFLALVLALSLQASASIREADKVKPKDMPKIQVKTLTQTAIVEKRHYVGETNYPAMKPHFSPLQGTIADVIIEPGQKVRRGQLVVRVSQIDSGQPYLRPYAGRAEISGLLSFVAGAPGALIQQNSLLFSIVRGTPRFDFYIPSFDLPAVNKESTFKIQSLVQPDKVFEGSFVFSAPGPHPTHGAHHVQIQVKDETKDTAAWTKIFPPQTPVNISVETKGRNNYKIAQKSVHRIGGKYFIWTLDPDSQLVARSEINVKSRIGNDFEFSLKEERPLKKISHISFSSKRLIPGRKVIIETIDDKKPEDQRTPANTKASEKKG